MAPPGGAARLKEELERRFDVEITDGALREAARRRNRLRRAVVEVLGLQRPCPPALAVPSCSPR